MEEEEKESRRYLWRLVYPRLGFLLVGVLSWRFRADVLAFSKIEKTAAIFGGLLTFSALLATVLLALLGIIASLDSRPLVKKIRDGGQYPDLVLAVRWPMFAFIGIALISLVALLLGTPAEGVDSVARRILTAVTFGLVMDGVLATLGFAQLLAHLMINPDGSVPPNKKNTPEAARERGAGNVALPPGHAGAPSMESAIATR